MLHFYLQISSTEEFCFNVSVNGELTANEKNLLLEVLTKGFDTSLISEVPFLDISENKGVEIGPNMNSETHFSTNVVSICSNIGLGKVIRIECSIRILTDDVEKTIREKCDRMTQEVYPIPIESFQVGREVQPVKIIPLIEEGIEAFDSVKGLSFSQQDKQIYYHLFVNVEKRNPTDVELFDLLNSNCEHSRHGWFNAIQIIDGVEKPQSAFDLVKSTLRKNPQRSVIGFHDNSSSIRGFQVKTLVPIVPGKVSGFDFQSVDTDITCTVETHNFPTGIEPYEGAATGTGGRQRDGVATGRGSELIAGSVGYCVASLHIPGYPLPGENPDFHSPGNMANALDILIKGSNGASNYGNEAGEPVLLGFSRNFDLRVGKQRWGYVKPILLAGGIGKIRHELSNKIKPEVGMLIVQIGGPAYRIGFGGGAASSTHQGDNDEELDFNAVQRGNAEMGNKVFRVVTTCNYMGINSPIASIHDQGAGGPANVLKELVEEAGGRVYIRRINTADTTMSTLEIWVCEFQERIGLLVYPDRIQELIEICEREKVPCEVLGEVTGDGRFVVEDELDGSTPVDFDLKAILADFPRSTYKDHHVDLELEPVVIPKQLKFSDALKELFKLLAVGSKGYLVHKVDRSVGGFVAQQQCVGPLQLPLANAAVVSLSHFDKKGAVKAQGEKPISLIVDPNAGARLAVAEMFLNMMSVLITCNTHIKCSVNWMWAPKKEGEGAALYDAVTSNSDFIPNLNVAIDGGKDSLSMAAEVDGELVKSPRTVVVTGYAPVEDITKVVTPDIKHPGKSNLIYIDLSSDQARLGASSFAQSLGQVGNETPDVDVPEILMELFDFIQQLISCDIITAYHDISDGGLITTLCEMAFAGNCGINVDLVTDCSAMDKLFAEELGVVIEIPESKFGDFSEFVRCFSLDFQLLGKTQEEKVVSVSVNGTKVLFNDTDELRSWWTETSFRLEEQQNNHCAADEKLNTFELENPEYHLTFEPEPTPEDVLCSPVKHMVMVLREEGSNGDKEMISALTLAGFYPVEVTMQDLLLAKVTLDDFRGLVLVGGFSYADCPESAKGWAITIENSPELKSMFTKFKNRPDTWSFSPCNGCQAMALLGFLFSDDMPKEKRPRLIKNDSGKFESRYTSLIIPESNSIMFTGMEASVLPVWSAHGEGKFFADEEFLTELLISGNVPVLYADNHGEPTMEYPFNPNGSPLAIAGLCSSDGRHTIMMPHPERLFQLWQFSWLPEQMQNLKASPWLRIFQNAREWCDNN